MDREPTKRTKSSAIKSTDTNKRHSSSTGKIVSIDKNKKKTTPDKRRKTTRSKLRAFFKPTNVKSKKRFTVTILYVCTILALALVVFLFTNKNAIAVYLGNDFIGNIKSNKKISSEYLQDLAIKKLETELNAKVLVNEQIVFKKVHSSKKNIKNEDYIVSNIYNKFTYKVECLSVLVSSVEVAVVANEAMLNQVYDQIVAKYIKDPSKVKERTFEEVTTTSKFVPSGDVTTVEKAYESLTSTTKIPQLYTVKKNDYLDGIAMSAGMTRDELLKNNTGLTENSVLQIGQQLNIIMQKPLLSVKTVEEIKYNKPVKKESEVRENPTKYKTYREIIQVGQDGENEITENIVKINGAEKERIIISTVPVVVSTPDIIEVGTGETR